MSEQLVTLLQQKADAAKSAPLLLKAQCAEEAVGLAVSIIRDHENRIKTLERHLTPPSEEGAASFPYTDEEWTAACEPLNQLAA